MKIDVKTTWALSSLTGIFLALAVAFLLDLWGHTPPLPSIPLVEPPFTNTPTVRVAYPDLVRAKEDLSDFDCYGCHDKRKPMQLRFDTNHNPIIPDVHNNIVLAHGTHNRNNNCFNCHNEKNLERFQTWDGRELTFADSTLLCGSCHGPTYRDWEAGAHGRTSGHWDRQLGSNFRKACVSCHDPHSPAFPAAEPAPGPNPLHAVPKTKTASMKAEGH